MPVYLYQEAFYDIGARIVYIISGVLHIFIFGIYLTESMVILSILDTYPDFIS